MNIMMAVDKYLANIPEFVNIQQSILQLRSKAQKNKFIIELKV